MRWLSADARRQNYGVYRIFWRAGGAFDHCDGVSAELPLPATLGGTSITFTPVSGAAVPAEAYYTARGSDRSGVAAIVDNSGRHHAAAR